METNWEDKTKLRKEIKEVLFSAGSPITSNQIKDRIENRGNLEHVPSWNTLDIILSRDFNKLVEKQKIDYGKRKLVLWKPKPELKKAELKNGKFTLSEKEKEKLRKDY